MEKSARQPSDTFAVAALLAVAGGFLDAYTYLCRGGVFANAQTGNMVLLAVRASEGRWREAAAYLAPILAFALGAVLGDLAIVRWGTWAILGSSLLLLACFGLMFCQEEEPHGAA